MNRTIYVSQETSYMANTSPNKQVRVFSFFPIDRAGCDCAQMIHRWKRRIAESNEKEQRTLLQQQHHLTCPRSNEVGMKRFVITCRACGEIQGYCYATTPELLDWCDFHYVQWADTEQWHGCFTPHISPITEQLCLECACGQDTRDFRANMKLGDRTVQRMESTNSKGRLFNRSDSKFLVTLLQGNVIR